MEYNLYTFNMWRGIADYLNNSGKFNYYFLIGKIKIWIVMFPLSHTNSQQIYLNNSEDLHIIQFYSNISFIFSLKCCFPHTIKSCFLIKLLPYFLRWLSPTGWFGIRALPSHFCQPHLITHHPFNYSLTSLL